MANLNRIKVVLVEQQKTGKWLAEQLGKSTCTVSKWVQQHYSARLGYVSSTPNGAVSIVAKDFDCWNGLQFRQE